MRVRFVQNYTTKGQVRARLILLWVRFIQKIYFFRSRSFKDDTTMGQIVHV